MRGLEVASVEETQSADTYTKCNAVSVGVRLDVLAGGNFGWQVRDGAHVGDGLMQKKQKRIYERVVGCWCSG